MYRYDAIDKEMLADRVAEFREQCEPGGSPAS